MSSPSITWPAAARRTAFGKIVLNEARIAWRRPVGLIAGVGIPLVLLILFGSLPAFKQHPAGFGGLSIFDSYVPILVMFSLAMIALLGLPTPLASHRELGVLRRLSTTPVSPYWLLVAQGLVQLCVAVVALIVIFVLSATAFSVPAPRNPGGLVLSIALSIAGLFSIGLVVAALARTANAASVIGRLLFFPLIFFAGLWLPRALMPSVLLDISNYSPLGAAVEAIQDSMLTGFPPVAPLLVLAGYAVVFGFLAGRLFRWE